MSESSPSFAEFTERVYGRNLAQTNFLDTGRLELLIEHLALKPGEQVLDLGCGTGKITEYLSDRTGAHFAGIDLSSSAIRIARDRCRDKHSRLRFCEGDMDRLDLPPGSLDAVTSVDTLYFATDQTKTVTDLAAALRPSGRMAIFFSHGIERGGSAERLEPRSTPAAKALQAGGLEFETTDCTAGLAHVVKRMRDAAIEMKDAMVAEGLAMRRKYYFSLLEGAQGVRTVQEGRSVRYLYIARRPS